MPEPRSPRSRIVVDASRRQPSQSRVRRDQAPRAFEPWIAISIIVAAALATFLALFITSRPFDPTTASFAPQQTIPAGPSASPSVKPSPTISPTPQNKPTPSPSTTPAENPVAVDDATLQSRIEAAMAADPALSKQDVSTLVENGKVTIVGSVRSPDLKQRVEKAIRAVKGVSGVNNQLVVNEATP